MFFDKFQALCDQRGVSVYRACTDIGLNRSAVAKWKAGGRPNGSTSAKLAEYFGVTTDYLLCDTAEAQPEAAAPRSVSEDDIIFALFGGDGEITKEMFDEVKQFAAFVKQREAAKKE